MRTTTDQGVLRQLADCIALPSPTPPGDAHAVAAWVERWGLEMGARVVRDPVWDGADNVLVTLTFGAGPRLALNTHMDVVDPSTQQWQSDPYRATRVDDRIHGRGTVDAKGSLVAMLSAMERVAADPQGLVGEVVLTAVVAEEAGGLGSLHLVESGFRADAAVVGEPTGLEVAHAHKGTYMRELIFSGHAAHSASPWLGHSAVADAAAFVAATERETERLASRPHPSLGPATMTVTKFHGGELQNTVPDEAVVLVDRRLIPGETHEECDRQLARILADLAEQRSGLRVGDPRTVVATVPSETDPTHAIVDLALAACDGALAACDGARAGVVAGDRSAPVGFNAGCDMSKFVGAGIPTVICGPGSLAQAHKPDEYVPVDQVLDAVAIHEGIIRGALAPDSPIGTNPNGPDNSAGGDSVEGASSAHRLGSER